MRCIVLGNKNLDCSKSLLQYYEIFLLAVLMC